MNRSFIKKLDIVRPEERVQDIDIYSEPLGATPWKFMMSKSLKRVGKVLIVLLLIFFIVYGPIYFKDYVMFKIFMGEIPKNGPLILIWIYSFVFMILCILLLALAIVILMMVYMGIIKPLIKWIMR